MVTGSIKWFGKQGFGFIVDNEGQEVFFHISNSVVAPTPLRVRSSSDQFAGDYDPVMRFLTRPSLPPELRAGCLPIKLTTVTPLLLPNVGDIERQFSEHQTNDRLNHLPRIGAYLNNPVGLGRSSNQGARSP